MFIIFNYIIKTLFIKYSNKILTIYKLYYINIVYYYNKIKNSYYSINYYIHLIKFINIFNKSIFFIFNIFVQHFPRYLLVVILKINLCIDLK